MVTSKYIQINDWCLVEYIYSSNIDTDGSRVYYSYYDVPPVKIKNNFTKEYSYIAGILNGDTFDPKSAINDYTKNCIQYSAFPVNQNKTLWAWGRLKNDLEPTDPEAIENDIWHKYNIDLVQQDEEPMLEYENTLQMKDCYFDTIRLHIMSGYSLSDIDGICFEVLFREYSTKNSCACQYFFSSNDKTDHFIFNQSPIMMSQKSYDKYLEFKVPALSMIQEEYWKYKTLDSNYAYIYSHPAKVNDYKTALVPGGFVKDSPIYFNLYEFKDGYSQDDIEYFYLRNKFTSSVSCDDAYSNLGCKIYESSSGDYFEYFATWENGFAGDYINSLNTNSSGKWILAHTIDIYEQNSIGNYVLTSTFSNLQDDNFNVSNYFRPILKYASTSYSYKINYRMQLLNSATGEGVTRTASYVGRNASKYGKKLTSINVSSGLQNINVFNKVINLKEIGTGDVNGGLKKTSPLYLGDNASLSTLSSTMEGVEYFSNGFNGPGYYATSSADVNSLLGAMSEIMSNDKSASAQVAGSDGAAIDRYNIAVNISENITSEPGMTFFGQAQLTIYISKFDNIFKFRIFELSGDINDSREFTSYNVSDKNLSMRFILDNGSVKEYPITISGENSGEVTCFIDKNAAALLLNQKDDRNFYIILTKKNGENTAVIYDTVLYSGKYKDLSEKSEELYTANQSLIEWITSKTNELNASLKTNASWEERLKSYQEKLNQKIKQYNDMSLKLLSAAEAQLTLDNYNQFKSECPTTMETLNDSSSDTVVNNGATNEELTGLEIFDNAGAAANAEAEEENNNITLPDQANPSCS